MPIAADVERDTDDQAFESILDDPNFKATTVGSASNPTQPSSAGPENSQQPGNRLIGIFSILAAVLSIGSIGTYLVLHTSIPVPHISKLAPKTSKITTPETQLPAQTTWGVGTCVKNVDVSAYPVSCSGPNNGTVTSRVKAGDDCPDAASTYVEDGGWNYCIEFHA